ncbi:hypothetical protein SD70_16280 [Gordoniibacillus kamchatkensis]|uniref:YheC/YheD family protein n=1 Tax=Gordoniibacillus kamchatkensis TaxID=1590651 RepID=A0ABR5AGA5_9BACL|nr:YheC/YheD family protein [Paenibacillus sp. VKM B-2647]KIL40074.1 hypothetical protein SD70_16280 [Paenibacillus sp. VKM B-2647]
MQEKLARLAKWKLHRFYARNSYIARYLPPTAMLTPNSLQRFMDAYKTVYIKASTVHTGKGIVKVWRTERGYRYVQVKGRASFSPSLQDLYRKLRQANPRRSYIVQKAIDLAEVNGRPFDIRVMMMRDGNRNWQYAGMVAKVAGPGSVVSNVRRGGGYVMTVGSALRQSLRCGPERIERIKKELITLSHAIMRYSEKYPFFSFQCGIDLAVDKNGRIWIIEVNLHNPSHGLFNKLSDKTFFRRIGRLYWAYRSKHKRII